MHMPDPTWRSDWNCVARATSLPRLSKVQTLINIRCQTWSGAKRDQRQSCDLLTAVATNHDRDQELKEGLSKCHNIRNIAVPRHAHKPALTKIYSRRF